MSPHPAIAGRTADGRLHVDVLRWITHGYWITDTHLLQGPGVITSLIPEATTQAKIEPRSTILHSNAGLKRTPWSALIAYWKRSDITGEAHFQVDGVAGPLALAQAIPFNVRADCNYKANSWLRGTKRVGAISFETQDNGGATLEQTQWSMEQLGGIVGALTCLCVCYGVACTAPATWDDSGIGYHCQFPEWSIYKGKTCPGAARIRQMDWIRQQVAHNLAEYGKVTGWKCGGKAA